MCGSYYFGSVVNQGYHVEDTQDKTNLNVGPDELRENYRADQIDAACKIREQIERRNFKGY